MNTRKPAYLAVVLLAFIRLVGSGEHRRAQADVAFMPGDAFFHADLTSAFLQSLPADRGDLILSYSHSDDSAAFGGHAGFERLLIKGGTPQVTRALHVVYEQLRRGEPWVVRIDADAEGNEVQTETNGFHLFVYNRDVMWTQQRIGNKYNENWMNLPPQAVTPTLDRPSGFGRVPATRYVSFQASYEGVVDDWKNASRFQALKVRVPNEVPWGLTGPAISDPVSIAAEEIQLLVCLDDDLTRYFRQEEDTPFFAISVDGVRRFAWTEKGLVSDEMSIEEVKGQEERPRANKGQKDRHNR
jgi:hypothetical protein